MKQMVVNNNGVVKWFYDRRGKLTYSQEHSRNGSDGTADCSGAITQAIRDSGGVPYTKLHSTVTLGTYLMENGYERISRNQDWDAELGDIVMTSAGNSMASSGGNYGHVGVMTSSAHFISVDWTTKGQTGTAVSEHIWNTYYLHNKFPYVEVWRLKKNVSPEIKVGDMVTLEKHATHWETRQRILPSVLGKKYQVLQVRNTNISNSKKAYLLKGVISWALEQDVKK